MYFVYMIKDASGRLYVEVTTDPKTRLLHHNTGRGAAFTKYNHAKFSIVFTEQYPSLADARRREVQIKKWRRDKKELLIKKCMSGQTTKLD